MAAWRFLTSWATKLRPRRKERLCHKKCKGLGRWLSVKCLLLVNEHKNVDLKMLEAWWHVPLTTETRESLELTGQLQPQYEALNQGTKVESNVGRHLTVTCDLLPHVCAHIWASYTHTHMSTYTCMHIKSKP